MSKGYSVITLNRGASKPETNGLIVNKDYGPKACKAFEMPPNVDCIINAAGSSPTTTSNDNNSFSDEIAFVKKLVDAAIKADIKKFIQISTISVFGDIKVPVISENTPIKNPDQYGLTKLAVEKIVSQSSTTFDTTILRCCGIVCENSWRPWLSQVVTKALKGQDIEIWRPNNLFNNLLHANSLVEACEKVIEQTATGQNRNYILASTNPISVGDVVGIVLSRTKSTSNITSTSQHTETGFILDTRKAQNELNFKPWDTSRSVIKLVNEKMSKQGNLSYKINSLDRRIRLKEQPDVEASLYKKNPKTLIIGANGNIGKELQKALVKENLLVSSRQIDNNCEQHLTIDLCDPSTWQIPTDVEIVYFCASQTSLGTCEENPKHSYEVNVASTIGLIDKISNVGARTIFISSNFVFDGELPYCKPTNDIAPATEYGKQKALVEQHILNNTDGTILRLSKVISNDNPLLLGWIEKLEKNQKIHPFFDLRCSPISMTSVIKILLRFRQEKNCRGVYQFSGKNDRSYYELALILANELGKPGLVAPISRCAKGIIDKFAPRHTTLDQSRISNTFGVKPEEAENVLAEFLNLQCK